MTPNRTMVWRYLSVSPLQLVVAHSEASPTDDEWNRYVGEARTAGERLATPRGSWALIMSEGGMVTATSWLGKEIRAYAPEHLDRAYEYLGIPPPDRPSVLRALAALRAELLGEDLG